MAKNNKSLSPRAAAEVIKSSVDAGRKDFTVADAAAASALSLHEAELGLHALVSEYRGHLRVTEDGEILFRFSHGFKKPWETTGKLKRALAAVGRAIEGAARFIVRAWVAIVLVGYTLIFVAILLAFLFGGRSERDSRSSSGSSLWLYAIFRLLGDALFWTFHPFSPFSVAGGYAEDVRFGRGRRRDTGPKIPFYERVDRFFFGPKAAPVDEAATERAVLAEIRAGKGRIGLADVMRITGSPREEIDPLMSQLLADYGGSVEVSEEGGIAYSFPELRKTVSDELPRRAAPIWKKKVEPPPITGNPPGSDLAIGALNAFNLIMSGWMLAQGLTIERLVAMFSKVPVHQLPPPGLPIALGVVPFVFSVALFLLPIGRLLWRRRTVKKAQRENGRRAVLQAVLESTKTGAGVTEEELAERYRIAAGIDPGGKEITEHVVALGGDIDMDEVERGKGVRFRFQDLELEAKAVEAEREAAADEEARPAKVIFSSEDQVS
jgi:hypothetical protein